MVQQEIGKAGNIQLLDQCLRSFKVKQKKDRSKFLRLKGNSQAFTSRSGLEAKKNFFMVVEPRKRTCVQDLGVIQRMEQKRKEQYGNEETRMNSVVLH